MELLLKPLAIGRIKFCEKPMVNLKSLLPAVIFLLLMIATTVEGSISILAGNIPSIIV